MGDVTVKQFTSGKYAGLFFIAMDFHHPDTHAEVHTIWTVKGFKPIAEIESKHLDFSAWKTFEEATVMMMRIAGAMSLMGGKR